MPPTKQSKAITIRGGVNVAPESPTPKSTTKTNTSKSPTLQPSPAAPPTKPSE